MSDKVVTEMNPTVKSSSGSIVFETENVDAIKKYIEEQEILLRFASDKDSESQIDREAREGEQNQLDMQLQLTFSSESQVTSSNSDLKQSIVSCPNKIGPESVYSEETTMSASSNDSLLEENEENLAKQAAANLLSLSQNCLKMHINIKQQKHSDEILRTNQESFKSKEDIISKFRHEELSDRLESNQQVEDTNDKNNIKLNGNDLCPKTSENELHESMAEDQNEEHTLNNANGQEALVKPPTSELETRDISTKDNSSEEPNFLYKLLTCSRSVVNHSPEPDKASSVVQENKEHCEESLGIATSVMDMILNNAEAEINKKQVGSAQSKSSYSSEKAKSSSSLAIGSKVEAKDFCELWHPAEIVEVDCEEMEVLVQYDNQPKMHNEWISISSPRLRPVSSSAPMPTSPPRTPTSHTPVLEGAIEQKIEDKQKVTFAVGERCLARWKDNRRFIATVQNNFGNGRYEVMFDDGFQWKCTLSRLYKLKESSGQHEYPQFVPSLPAATASPPASPAPAPSSAPAPDATSTATPAPDDAAATTAPAPLLRLPAFHTHLFDPTRDYLGSKSERREKKRKLNIKEIFNIGKKRKKLSTIDKASKKVVTCVKEEQKSEIKLEPGSPLPEPALPVVKDTSSVLQTNKVIAKKPSVKKKPLSRKKIKLKNIDVQPENIPSKFCKNEKVPEAVASIIGTVCKMEPEVEVKLEPPIVEDKDSNANDVNLDEQTDEILKPMDITEIMEKKDMDIDLKGETYLFELQDEVKHEEVMGKIKEVITKLEDGINEVEKKEIKQEVLEEEIVKPVESVETVVQSTTSTNKEKPKKSSSKVRKVQKLRFLQDKKVKEQVAKVKFQLEEVKKQVELMRQQIMLKTQELASARRGECAAPEAALLPGEWACRWLDGQPEGLVSEVPAAGDSPLPRRCVQVEDKRLPAGWTKHMVRRSLGSSAGKWDVVLVSPENRRFHTKGDMRAYLENEPQPALKPFEAALLDFGIHHKLAKRLGWVRHSAEGAPPPPPPSQQLPASSPLLKRTKLSLNKNRHKLMHHKKRPVLKIKPLRPATVSVAPYIEHNSKEMCPEPCAAEETVLDGASIKDGFVDVGSLRVQVIETLLRCPAEDCFKNFRNTTLLKMHIKHYHRELRKTMGNTPKVLDLAYARTKPTEAEMKRCKRDTPKVLDLAYARTKPTEAEMKRSKRDTPKVLDLAYARTKPTEAEMKRSKRDTPKVLDLAYARTKPTEAEMKRSKRDTPKVLDLAYARTKPTEAEMNLWKRDAQQRIVKVKLPRLPKRALEEHAPPPPADSLDDSLDDKPPKPLDASKPAKRPRVLLPVRTKEPELKAEREPTPEAEVPPVKEESIDIEEHPILPKQEITDCGEVDFESAISSHTVAKMVNGRSKEKRRKTFACIDKGGSSEEEWGGSDPDTRSSYASCGTPDSAAHDDLPAAPLDSDPSQLYMYTDNGERIKLVRMKREEIINCHCGLREEDGLMVQCELCLCWQHALCHNIQRESEVPEKYTCSICLNPRRGRRRQRFTHDQDRLYEGLLPGPGGGRACDALRRSHELAGNLLRIEDALHAVRVNTTVAQTKNHPKLYLWARDWESVELSFAQEKLNSEYSNLNVIVNNLGKENLPIKAEDLKEALDTKSPSDDREEKHSPKTETASQVGSPALPSGLVSGPGAASLDLPISGTELEKVPKTVHEHESRPRERARARARAPQPEAAIENGACRARLLRHLQRCHALLDQRLDSVEAQVAELESQDALLEDDESADFCPRAKQAMVMIARDLDAMEELGIVT